MFANNVEVAFFGINQDGRALRTTRTELNLTLRPESLKRVKGGGLRINERMTLEPGRYQIRVGYATPTPRSVRCLTTLSCPISEEQVMMSGLLLTATSAQSAMTAQPDKAAPRACPGPDRPPDISRNDTVTVFAEIYDNISRQQPREIETAVSLTSETGQDVFNARDSIPNPSTSLGASSSTALRAGTAGYRTAYRLARDIPLKDVAAGRYLLKVEAKLRGNTGPVVQETLITVQ